MFRMTLPTTCLVLALAASAAHAGDAEGTEAGRPVAEPVVEPASARTLDDLVRAAGLDAGMVAAQLRRARGASPADARFALIFCPVHERYEPRSGASRFAVSAPRRAIDPLLD